jgi:tRNA dimethylallyltransferase
MKFSVAKYQELALKYIGDVLKERKMPIIVGGTGLYINSLVYNIEFPKTVCDWVLRRKLDCIAKDKGNLYLYKMLMRIDKEAADRLHFNDIKRVIRAVEVYKYKKDNVLENRAREFTPKKYEYIIFGLDMERRSLYKRINERVDGMFQRGLVDEVKNLKDRGYTKENVAMQAIGYKEVLEYLENRLDLNEVVELVKRNSRRYAKRQLTWFRKLPNVSWLDFKDDVSESNFQEKLSVMLKHLELSCRI